MLNVEWEPPYLAASISQISFPPFHLISPQVQRPHLLPFILHPLSSHGFPILGLAPFLAENELSSQCKLNLTSQLRYQWGGCQLDPDQRDRQRRQVTHGHGPYINISLKDVLYIYDHMIISVCYSSRSIILIKLYVLWPWVVIPVMIGHDTLLSISPLVPPDPFHLYINFIYIPLILSISLCSGMLCYLENL